MPRFHAILAACAMLLTACGRHPGDFPVPLQRAASEGRDPGELGNFIRMDDPLAEEYIVKDITREKSAWRWTLAKPEVKLRVRSAERLTFIMEFFVVGATFRDTGPVMISCYINDQLLGSMHCPKPGKYRFEKPVPKGWVQPNVAILVRPVVDKLWVSKEDGAQLGFLLGAIGFPQEP